MAAFPLMLAPARADFAQSGDAEEIAEPVPPGDANIEPMCNDVHWTEWGRGHASRKEPPVNCTEAFRF